MTHYSIVSAILESVTSAARIYLAQLPGITVLGPNGDHVGRVRDTVIRFSHSKSTPRATGLVVQIQQRRQIFVPLGRIMAIESDAVILATSTLSLSHFSLHPGEELAVGSLLDQKVTIAATETTAVIVDLAIEQRRNQDWVISKVAVKEIATSRLSRRRGQLHQLEWSEIIYNSTNLSTQGAANLLEALGKLLPADLAQVMGSLSDKRQSEVAAALDDERLADVLEEMPEEVQVKILESLEESRAATILEAMDPDDAADLLAELPQHEQERLLTLMSPDDAGPLRQLLLYSDDTAGGLMTTRPVILVPDATVAEALARLRETQVSPALATQVFVCRPPTATPTGHFLGIVHIQRLLREPPSELVGGLVDKEVDPLRPHIPLAEITRQLATYNLVTMPVINESHRLVGAVTVDDVLDHILPRNWRERNRV